MSDILDTLWKERNDLRERVKELEKERDAAEAELWGANYFTDEMIDEAVEYATAFGHPRVVNDLHYGAWVALNKLHIFRCNGYGCEVGYVQGVKCPKCNSHGWVIGD